MQRLRGYDIRTSDFPESVGLCSSDQVGVFNFLNSSQRRLVYCIEAGDESWWGTWAEIAFTASQTTPFVTFDRNVARLEFVDACDHPITVNNQFQEYLRFGNGRFPKLFRQGHRHCMPPEAFTRSNVPTQVDIPPGTPQLVQAFATLPQDIGKRVLIQGMDQNNLTIYSQDGFNRVTGQFMALANPFVQWPMLFSTITGIQKDVTAGPVNIMSMDPNTGAQVLLAAVQPTETTAWYRRYFFDRLPFNCCSVTGPNPCSPTLPTPSSVALTAIVKLEFIPVCTDTDYCLIQNLEALKEEGLSYRYSKMDSMQSKQLEAIKHKSAVRLLNGEIAHYLGTTKPAVNIALFGSARLERQGIGMML